MITTKPLIYRLYQEDDLPGLLRLWEEEAGWGSLTPETWHQWYVDTPYGPCLVVVAVDENGDIVGQEVFNPSSAIVGNQQVRALRISAPILRKGLRRASLRNRNHPIIRLYDTAMDIAVKQGYSLVYAVTRKDWLSFLKWESRFTDIEYDCLASPLAPVLPETLGEATYLTACTVTEFGREYDALWQSARDTFPISFGVVRQSDVLRYKNGGHITLEVRDTRDNSLVGYTATKKQSGLLVDILARCPADITPVLATTLNWFASEQNKAAQEGITCLKTMETAVLRPALQALNFTPVDYKFALICNTLDPSLTPEAISLDRWYVTPGD